jgi:hypothetical protein
MELYLYSLNMHNRITFHGIVLRDNFNFTILEDISLRVKQSRG